MPPQGSARPPPARDASCGLPSRAGTTLDMTVQTENSFTDPRSTPTIPGTARPAALEEYARAHPCALPRRRMSRMGWLLPSAIVGGGGDGLGYSNAERADMMIAAVTHRGYNAICFDADDMQARYSKERVAAPSITQWERYALQQLLARPTDSGVGREAVVLICKVSVNNAAQSTLDGLRERVAAAALQLGIAAFDIVLIELPPAAARLIDLPASSFSLVSALEHGVVNAGLAQMYGFAADAFALDHDDAAYDARHLLEASQRVGDGHHLGVLAYTFNLLRLHAAFSSVQPQLIRGSSAASLAQERASGESLADYLRSKGIFQLARQPLDCVSNGRPFRCVDVPTRAGGQAGTQPTDINSARAALSQLNDVLNWAIHCEVKWESEVRSAASNTLSGRSPAVGEASAVQRATPSAVVSGASDAGGSSAAATRGAGANLMEGGGGPSLQSLPLAALQPRDVTWARGIAANLPRFTASLLEWRWAKAAHVLPALERLQAVCLGLPEAAEWAAAYRLLMLDVVSKVDALAEAAHAERAAAVRAVLVAELPQLDAARGDGGAPQQQHASFLPPSLTQMVLQLLLSCPVDAVMTEVPEAIMGPVAVRRDSTTNALPREGAGQAATAAQAGSSPSATCAGFTLLPADVVQGAVKRLSARGSPPAHPPPPGSLHRAMFE